MPADAFPATRVIDHLPDEYPAVAKPRPSLLVTFCLAAALTLGGAVLFPVSFAILAGTGYGLYELGHALSLLAFGRIEWVFAGAFGLAGAVFLLVLLRGLLAFEGRCDNHRSYRFALHLWRSLALFAVVFVGLGFATHSAEIRVPLIAAGLAALAFQAILLRRAAIDPDHRLPILAPTAALLLLVALGPASFALHRYAGEGVVAQFGTPEQKRQAAHAASCTIDGRIAGCEDRPRLFADASGRLLYRGPIPPLWIIHRDLVGTPVNQAAWQTFKTDLRAFSNRDPSVASESDRLAFGHELARIFGKWAASENAFTFGANSRQRTSTMRPPAFLFWVIDQYGAAPGSRASEHLVSEAH